MNSLSIVLPVHNEKDNLNELVRSWSASLRFHKLDYEFVIVEDGSTDGTKELIKELEKKYPIVNLSQNQKRGYGLAVLDGIYKSTKEYILCTDSDNQIKVHSLINNLNNFPKENTFLIGYRNPRKDPFNRIIYSKLFKLFHDLLFNSNLKDPSCPFFLGSKQTYLRLEKKKLLQMREGFWWGFVGVCKKEKLNFKEVPIDHFKRKSGEAGYKLGDLFSIIFRNVLGLIKIKFFR